MGERRRWVICHPGADWATHDVYAGLLPALGAAGVDVGEYRLDRRIPLAAEYMGFVYDKQRKKDPDIPEPTFADTLYLAGERLVTLALRTRCDWVVIVSAMYVPLIIVEMLRLAGRKVALLLTESPYDDEQQAKWAAAADVVWTNERTSVPFLRRYCAHTHYLPHAFDPAAHRPAPLDPTVPEHDVLFVGTAFQERVDLLGAVDWGGIGAGLALYGNWDTLPPDHRLTAFVRGAVVANRRAAAMYRRAAININIFRTSVGFGEDAPRITGAESLNPRALELAACGAFFLSDDRAESREVFGDLVPTFSTAKELEALIARYLHDPQERQRRAERLPGCVAGRTFGAMARRIVADLDAYDAERMGVEVA